MLKNIIFQLGVRFGNITLRLLFGLNKKIIKNSEILDKIRMSNHSIIIGCWHGRLLFPFYFLRNRGIFGLAGLHRDAEMISRIGEKMGWKMIRGSSSLGGKGAYEVILKLLMKGENMVALTPDGPKGPRMKAKRGAIRAAQRTGAVIIPVSGQSSRRWEVKNWDLFVVPKPFGRSVFIFGDPLFVKKSDNIDLVNIELEKRLNFVQNQADALINEKI